MSELALIRAVVVHPPDFLVAGAIADKINFALGDAGNAATQAEDDLVGELVGDDAGSIVAGNVGVLLAENLRRRRVLHVVEPALNNEFAGGDAKIAEGQHGGVRRRGVPDSEGDLGWLAGHLQGVEALGDEFDDAGIVQIVPESIVESLEQRVVLGIAVGRFEVRNGKADFFDAESGTGANPILGEAGRRKK